MSWLNRTICILYSSMLFYTFPLISSSPQKMDEAHTCITVFVHGIIGIQPYLSLNNIINLKLDCVADTAYAHGVYFNRTNPFFYQHHAMYTLGLQSIDLNAIAPGNAPTAFARAYDTIAHKANYACEQNLYFTFGWSGLVSQKARETEAENLYQSLLTLLQPYYAQGIYPTVRIVGYSHGGCVALELARAHQLAKASTPLAIDELILIGMPVTGTSIVKIQNPLFKRIYHIYSEDDRVQRIDFFSVKGFFSNQTFKRTSCHDLPEKLTQINFKMFRLTRFYEEKWKNCLPDYPLGLRHLRPAHPGHVEFWSFGWIENYRERLPYHPLPGAVFIPYLIQSASCTPSNTDHITVEIHPYNASIIVKAKKKKFSCQLPFLTNNELYTLRQDALAFRPENFSHLIFEKNILESRSKGLEKFNNSSKSKTR